MSFRRLLCALLAGCLLTICLPGFAAAGEEELPPDPVASAAGDPVLPGDSVPPAESIEPGETTDPVEPEDPVPPEPPIILPPLIYGDVDLDGVIGARDALMVLQHTVRVRRLSEEEIQRADVDCDGMIRALDALIILQYSIHRIDTLPLWTVPDPDTVEMLPGLFRGIDVSTHNKTIDWAAVQAAGIDFAMVRTGFGRDHPNQTDAFFAVNVAGAKAAGLSVGCYHYSYATSVEAAIEEARFMIGIMGDNRFDYPVVLDLEDPVTQGLGKETITDIAIAFLDTLKMAGYYPMLYSNPYWLENYLDISRLRDYDLWLAQWKVAEPTYTGRPFTMWQYTSDGTVNGVSGRVDMNLCYVDYSSYIKNKGYNGYGASIS